MKTLQHYLKRREDGILSMIGRYHRASTPASFHQLRIEIKKLDALFHVVHYCSKTFQRKKTFTPIKLIFHQAGFVRDLQVEASCIKKYVVPYPLSQYQNDLKRSIDLQKEKFYSLIDKNNKTRIKKICSEIAGYFHPVTPKKTKKYIEQQLALIHKFIYPGPLQKRKSHDLRKLIKLIHYAKSLLNWNKENKSSSKNVDLATMLGKWHDRTVIIRHLQQIIRYKRIPAKEMIKLNPDCS